MSKKESRAFSDPTHFLHPGLREFRQRLHEVVLWPVRFSRWDLIPVELDRLLAHGLELIGKTLSFDRGAIFFYDRAASRLIARQILSNGMILSGEEEIPLQEGTELQKLIDGDIPNLIHPAPECLIYMPLFAFGEALGVLRMDRSVSRKPIRPADAAVLKSFVEELAFAVRAVELSVSAREQVNHFMALSDISFSIYRSLRLDEMLNAVCQSLISRLGFDRIKAFLVNKEGNLLEEIGMADHRRRFSLSDRPERIPMHREDHPLISLLKGDQRTFTARYRQTLLYLPLRTRDESIGLLIVDNLLSQQEISQQDIQLLSNISGQLALAIKNARLFEGVEELSITDGLTGLFLLRYFRQRLREEFFRAERSGAPLSIIIFDLDHFKSYNDNYGHPAGDIILSTVSKRVMSVARRVDLCARYGGDEFIMLLPDTEPHEALLLAERVRNTIRETPIAIDADRSITVTASLGVASYPSSAATMEELLKRADDALYWAKSHGRDQSRVYSEKTSKKR